VASVWVEGVDDLNSLSVDLGRAGQVAGEKASLVVRKTLLAIEGDAKAFAPVDTGMLRNSIGTDMDGDGLGGEAGPSASYGAFVEFGTSRNAPQAFMGPAFDRHSGQFEKALAQIAADVL
jgi:HK97 gp10 family phage protein